MPPREAGRVPLDALKVLPKGETIDLPRRRESRRAAREAPLEPPEEHSAAALDAEDQRQMESLTEQLRFLLKRLEIAKDTLSDPRAVQEISKNYRKRMNEKLKNVVGHDGLIKPLRSEIKQSNRAIDEIQKEYDQGSGMAKFLRDVFPALDSTGRELRAMRADLEAKKKDLEKLEEKRAKDASSASNINDRINSLHQAEAIVAEINILTRKAS